MYENLPIFKKALELNVYVESIVKNFDKYNKYHIGSELREKSRQILYAIYKIYMYKDKQIKDYEFFDDVKFLFQKILFDNPTKNYIKKGNKELFYQLRLANSHKLIKKYQMKKWIKKENKNNDKKINHSSFVYNSTILCR
jgi:hypothetical protein